MTARQAFALARDPLAQLRRLSETGPVATIRVGRQRILVLNRHELVREMLTERADSFERGMVFDRIRPVLGNGLVNSSGVEHRAQRRRTQPAFSRDRIASYAVVMAKRADEMVATWRPGEPIRMDEQLHTLTLTTAAETMFSAAVAQRAVAEVRRSLPIVMRDLIFRALLPAPLDRLPLPVNRRFDRAATRLRTEIGAVVRDYRQVDADRGDLLSMLVAAVPDDNQLRDELITMLVAGTETSGTTMAWALYELARAPAVERAVRAEIDACDFADHTSLVARLPTLSRVLNETLRLHSPPILMRRTTESVRLGRFRLRPGVEVAYSPYVLHRDPRVFPDPDMFAPRRWENDRVNDLPRGAFTPFGAGRHTCIGREYAWTSMLITLSRIYRTWRLSVTGGPVTEQVAAIVRPDVLTMIVQPTHSNR